MHISVCAGTIHLISHLLCAICAQSSENLPNLVNDGNESDFCLVDSALCTYVVVKLSRLVKLSSLVKCESRKSQLLPLDTLCVCCHRIQKVVLHKYPYGHVVSLS